jgi:hypothetical protein
MEEVLGCPVQLFLLREYLFAQEVTALVLFLRDGEQLRFVRWNTCLVFTARTGDFVNVRFAHLSSWKQDDPHGAGAAASAK